VTLCVWRYKLAIRSPPDARQEEKGRARRRIAGSNGGAAGGAGQLTFANNFDINPSVRVRDKARVIRKPPSHLSLQAIFDKPSDDGDDWQRIVNFFQYEPRAGA
jgi:hypothetical protein